MNEVISSRDFTWFVQTLLSLLLIVKYPWQALREIVIEQKNSEKKLQIVDVVHLVSLQEDLKKVHCEGLKISSKLLYVSKDLLRIRFVSTFLKLFFSA